MRLRALLLILVLASCKNQEKMQTDNHDSQEVKIPGPAAVVYKTRADYDSLVPITLSADKRSIVSYPDPTDLGVKTHRPYPSRLHQGYLLDRRGINRNVAFLKLTYNEYASLPAAPSLDEFHQLLLDKDPLTEYYECGHLAEMENPVQRLNEIIDNGRLKELCKW